MSNLKFAETHNLVAFLEKPEESDGFERIFDFLNASSIRYALTMNTTILLLSCIKAISGLLAKGKIAGHWRSADTCPSSWEEVDQLERMGWEQRKDIEVPQPNGSTEPITDEAANEEHVPTHSNDLLLSGEDRLKLNKLMDGTLSKQLNIKAVKTAATKTTTAVIRPKARGDVFQEPSEFRTTTSSLQTSQLPQMEANYELGFRGLKAKEQGELTIEERSKLFVKLINKRKKHFAKIRAEEIIRKPPTKAQKRNQMCTYLKNMANYKHSQLKNKSFEEIQMLFDNTMKWVDSFVPMDLEVVEGSKS
ncbi:hypothetical protein Tco_0490808 [Tanacetum coccineum]